MRKLKTDELGLHPLTLQDLGYLQSSVLDGLSLLANSLTGSQPCILSGIQLVEVYNIGGSNFQYEVTEGIYWSGSELLFHEYSYHVGPISSTVRLQILETNLLTPVTYKSGVSKNVYKYGYVETNLTIGLDLDNIPRLETILEQRLGVNVLKSDVNTAKANIIGLLNNVNNIIATMNAIDQQLQNHLLPGGGGHPWSDISSKPYSHGSAYLGDIGLTSPAFPHVMGANCRRVAGTSNDSLYEIKLPNNSTINGAYHVYGSIVGVKAGWTGNHYQGVLWDDCNDLSWSIVKKDPTQFHIAVREHGGIVQDLWFEFMIVDLSKV